MQNKLTHLQQADYNHFESIYIDLAGSLQDDLTYKNFKEIVFSYRKFNRSIVNMCLEKLVKKTSNSNEETVLISKII